MSRVETRTSPLPSREESETLSSQHTQRRMRKEATCVPHLRLMPVAVDRLEAAVGMVEAALDTDVVWIEHLAALSGRTGRHLAVRPVELAVEECTGPVTHEATENNRIPPKASKFLLM